MEESTLKLEPFEMVGSLKYCGLYLEVFLHNVKFTAFGLPILPTLVVSILRKGSSMTILSIEDRLVPGLEN